MRAETVATGLIVAVGAAITIGIWVLSSYLEARAFNSVTGGNVSTLEAMFVELRVQESVK